MYDDWTMKELDVGQANDFMIVNYVHKIVKKWEAIQGHKIKSYDDLSEDAQKEIDDWYNNFPTDLQSIKKLIKKRDANE